MITAIFKIIAAVSGWFFSDRRAKAKDQARRDEIAKEVADGDEDKVNARLGKFHAFPWLLAGTLCLGGCFSEPKTVYVREQDKVRALQPGAVYTNETDAVEWIVPRTKMTQLVISAEGL